MTAYLLKAVAIFLVATLLLDCQPTRAEDDDDDAVDIDEDEEDEGPDFESFSVNGQKIEFGIPEDDDDFHSLHIPKEFRCDACKIIAKKFTTAFDNANAKRPSLKKNLPESDVIDILEGECEDEFMQVGVKEVKGVKRLTGPGMPTYEEVGIMQGGGKWPIRMKALCLDVIGEVEEDELYNLYKDGKLQSHLCLTSYKQSNCITTTKSGMKRIEL